MKRTDVVENQMIAKARLLVTQSGLLVMQMLGFFAHQYGNARGAGNIQKDLRQIRIARLYLDEQKDTEKCHQRHKGENRTKINGIFLAAQTETGAQKQRNTQQRKIQRDPDVSRTHIHAHRPDRAMSHRRD